MERQPIESPFGAFIACSDGERTATVRILDADERVLLNWTFGGHFAPDRLPTALGGIGDFHHGLAGADRPPGEAGIHVSTGEVTNDEMRQLLRHTAEGPSGLSVAVRDELQRRLEEGDDPGAIAEWLMTVRREPDQDGVG
ncbi:MAG: hypothetical protein AB1673_11885 [Actinomycetota bacterium]